MWGSLKAAILILVCLAILVPFASRFPDGLERLAGTLRIEPQEPMWKGLMPDYRLPTIDDRYVSTFVAGAVGIILILVAAFLVGTAMTRPRNDT
jgi:hypothetical protein